MRRKTLKLIKSHEVLLLAITLVLSVGVGLYQPQFLSLDNVFAILKSSSFLGILSIGFLFVLISGGIDISFTATATVAQYLMALALRNHQDFPVILVVLIPLLVGFVLGSVNGLLIHYLKVPPIIVSIASLNIFYGLIQYGSKGRWIYDFPPWFRALSKVSLGGVKTPEGIYYGFSLFSLLWLLVALGGALILGYTTLGRKIYALGGSEEATKRQGVNILFIRWFVYAFLGLISGLGALVHTLVTQTAAPNALLGQEFDVVTAVVLGGALITGGKGSVLGSVLGVLFVAILKNSLVLMGVPSYWHQLVVGAVFLASVLTTANRDILIRILRGRKYEGS